MKILVVSPYAPLRDGIAAYALQYVKRMRAAGHDVEVLSPQPSAAHHYVNTVGARGSAALGRYMARYDRVVVQYHPDYFYPVPVARADRYAITLALGRALRRAPQSELVLHEFDYQMPSRARREAARFLLGSATRVTVHTARERDMLADAVGWPKRRINVADHGANFTKSTDFDRDSARVSLGIDADAHVFLCIGFIQPHKGFDRALRAFAGIDPARNRIYVVGSVRLDDAPYVAHAQELRDLATATPGAEVVLGYTTDELFDRWIVASDTVVLPYRQIWSSGVIERAALYGKRVIVSDIGGLSDQLPDSGVLVANDAELAAAMRADALGGSVAPPRPARVGVRADATQSDVMRVLHKRADGIRGSTSAHAVTDPRAPIAPLLTLTPLASADLASPSRVRGVIKRGVAKLTRWETDPLVRQINALQRATIEALRDDDTKPRS